jgi:hypothetical protein
MTCSDRVQQISENNFQRKIAHKIDCHNIAEILLKVASDTITSLLTYEKNNSANINKTNNHFPLLSVSSLKEKSFLPLI